MSASRWFSASAFKLTLLVFLLVTSAICLENDGEIDDNNIPDIAIIGGGIGGTSAAYFLREQFGGKAKIDLFEAQQVGGRLSSVIVDGREYESGGSIIHPRNRYMLNFTEMLGLRKRESHSGKMGIYNGEELVFSGSEYGIIAVAKMFWRYGMDIYNINTWVDNMLTKFERIYQYQEEGIAFTTVEGLLESMNRTFVEYTRTTIRNLLKEEGYSDLFIDELVTAGMRVNYGQGADVHGFVGAVGMAGISPGLWSVHGGNRQVPEKLIEKSSVNFLHAEVTSVTLERDDNNNIKYDLRFIHSNLPDNAERMFITKQYDIVIVATPLHRRVSDITFDDFPHPIHYMPQEFHRTDSNFIQGAPNMSYFCPCGFGHVPTVILCNNLDLAYNSFAENKPVDLNSQMDGQDPTKLPVWKMFSSSHLPDELLDDIFERRRPTQVTDWLAYPEYRAGDELPSFVLYDQLYYVNAIEMAASAMEMSAIGSKNVAILAYNHWYSLYDKIDELHSTGEQTAGDADTSKTEL